MEPDTPFTTAPAGAYAYLLACADGTLYAGWTTDVERRVDAHNRGAGAKYTRPRRPVRLLACWAFPSREEAMRFEYRVKQLSKAQKLALAAGVALGGGPV